jgi:hypothetical protein
MTSLHPASATGVSVPRLRFRMATPQDAPEIVDLLNQGFRTRMDTATWEWYVYANPLGPSRVYVAHNPSDTLIGVIGFAPIPLCRQGRRVTADYAHHLVLEPSYRDTLSYLLFLRHSLNAQAAHGVEMIIGPPNTRAYPIHKALMKWVDFGYLDRLRKLKPSPREHSCREVISFSEDFEEFYRNVAKDLVFHLDKNAAWMNWRFWQRPGQPYTVYATTERDRMTGYIILKRWQDPDGYRKTHILDLHAVDGVSLSNLIAAAETYAFDCDELNLWAVQGYAYRPALESVGFSADYRQPLLAKTFDGASVEYPEGPCSLMYGDGDTLY